MNKPLSTAEIDTLGTILVDKPVMTRKEKLLRWASLIRQHTGTIVIFNGLEYARREMLDRYQHPQSAFAIAARDQVLSAAGLKEGHALAAVEFFNLTQNELHRFSCDCGGLISNEDMARRIESLA